MGMEELPERSGYRRRIEIPEMGEILCKLYPAADCIIYLCTGIYHHVLKHIGE